MWTFPKLHVSIFGMLMFGILQGTCGVLTDIVKVLKVGSSLDLPYQHPIDSEVLVLWRFNGTRFAEYSKEEGYELLQSQFSGRLKKDNDSVRVTVEDLQYQDSGTFSVSGLSIPQYPTQMYRVTIQSPITAVQIEKSQTWSVSTNSCDVDVRCKTLGAESISYLWSGYKTEREDHLQFTLSPEEGIVTLNCTAANNVSSSSATETLRCGKNAKGGIPDYVWIAVGGGGATLVFFICLIVAMCCRWRSRKEIIEGDETVYAYIDLGASGQQDKRSDSVINGMTLYETVDDFRVNHEMTIYSKVAFPKPPTVSATSSPSQQVL